MDAIHILEGSLLHWIEVLFLSGIKFLFAPALSMGLGFSYFQTVIVTSIGGFAGVYFFYYLSGYILNLFRKYIKPHFKGAVVFRRILFPAFNKDRQLKNKRTFTFRNKAIVRTRANFGILGIAILTPVFLSIPLGAFLVNRYYANCKKKFIYLGVSVVLWSFLVSSLLFLIRFAGTQPVQ
jgi:hypothetical protein